MHQVKKIDLIESLFTINCIPIANKNMRHTEYDTQRAVTNNTPHILRQEMLLSRYFLH